ncbi:hypothetical protein GCM10025853_03310 [Tetragenococcus halophilus subsp. halophilus DSM 20339]|nr:hypothetical protein GCM10025853_03310 [Tetragenococcus halophilus subsp. halophilus DSM 20339]
MSLDTYDMNELFDVDFTTTKAQRLDYGESLMTHAMVLTGVDIVDDKSTKWKVENSWGDKVGDKGFCSKRCLDGRIHLSNRCQKRSIDC